MNKINRLILLVALVVIPASANQPPFEGMDQKEREEFLEKRKALRESPIIGKGGKKLIEKNNADTENFREAYYRLDELASKLDPMTVPSRTKAQLQQIAPAKAGLIYYCSDCTTDGIVVSTGTAAGAFGRISARSTAIN